MSDMRIAGAIFLIAVSSGFGVAESLRVEAVAGTDAVHVNVAGKPFTTYAFAKDQKYPYFYPVSGPATSESVTTESSEPYPHHHSLFFACDKVNGSNYWQESNEAGQVVSQGPRIVEASGERAIVEDTCLWQRPGGEPDFRDTRTIVISAPSASLRTIDFAITLEPLKDVRILKSNHSLFAARVVPELNVLNGGRLVNADGKEKEAGTYGVASPWCSYSGVRDGMREGIAVFQHPQNRWNPAPWFTRDYGFFSPTPMQWLEGDALELRKGESLTLRYRVLVFSGDPDLAQQFAEYESARQKLAIE